MDKKKLGKKIAKTLATRGYRRCTCSGLCLGPGETFRMERGLGRIYVIKNASDHNLFIRYEGRLPRKGKPK